MPINLLQHKSWHVWNKDNIERVKRDEALHEQQQKAKRKRDLEIESEVRLRALKANKGERSSSLPQISDEAEHSRGNHCRNRPDSSPVSEHVNLFKGVTGLISDGNVDKALEDKELKKREERRRGVAGLNLTLAQSVYNKEEKRHITPWYSRPKGKERRNESGLSDKDESNGSARRERVVKATSTLNDDRMKSLLDPLAEMQHYIHETEEIIDIHSSKARKHKSNRKHKKHKKHKH